MMWSQAQLPVTLTPSSSSSSSSSSCAFSRPVVVSPLNYLHLHSFAPRCFSIHLKTTTTITRASASASASLGESSSIDTPTLLPNKEVEQSIGVLKDAAKTRKVSKNEVLSALSVIEKAKLDPSNFLETLGGTESPGRTWMLIFTAEKQLKGGRYFPLTAIQRFDAVAKRIENGVYLGSLGSLTFEGRLSWKKRILAFIFERIRLKVGPFNPLEFGLGNEDNSEPGTKNPFFIWFYVDEEIAVARGRSGGTAFWCRCRRVTNP